ncbi:MAG: hypothetical protein ACRDIE_16620, partial [Chloroflexota bacterium]
SGTVGHSVTDLATHSGTDRVGRYVETDFTVATPSAVVDGIRLYAGQPIVLFTQRYLAAAAPVAFPVLGTYPRGLYHVSYSGKFGIYNFKKLDMASPWLFFNTRDQAFLLSPAEDFLLAHDTMDAGGTLRFGLASAITRVPRGYRRQTLLTLGNGINATYDRWGLAMTELQGKTRLGDEAATELKYLGYWTDNGAAYYYHYDTALGYEGTLLAVRGQFQQLGIPLGYMELDSWWYPKGSSATWPGNGYERGGIYQYTAAPALFPNGLAAFQRRLGVPLAVHARWIDPGSPYRRMYRMSGNVITDSRYWQATAAYLAGAGVITYEQDWLADLAHTNLNLQDPSAFLDHMAAAMQARGIDLQYCMPLPADLLQSTRYANLATVRVSDDHFSGVHWDSDLFDSRQASALGLWPWTDVFDSGQTDNLLLSVLSGGIVGVGDPLDALDATNLHRAMRGDGVLVKPDAPIVPDDAAYLAEAAGTDQPMVAFTYSDRGNLRDLYVFAYRRKSAREATFVPANLGVRGPTYVYNYFRGTGKVVAAGAAYHDAVGSGSYYVAAPIGPSGIALLGDLGRFVSMGTQRIGGVADTGTVQLTIHFGSRERSVTLSGYAIAAPRVKVIGGSAGAVSYDAANHLFHVAISPAPGTTDVKVRLTPRR